MFARAASYFTISISLCLSEAVAEKHTWEKNFSLESDWNSLYVAGECVNRGDRRAIKDQNPYTGEVIAELPPATAEDVDHAFYAASRSQDRNMDRTPQQLAQPILEGINVILANKKF
ncbi:MAG: aldehyde dehydrogenase family protein [Candidatus Nitrosopolaris sp.]